MLLWTLPTTKMGVGAYSSRLTPSIWRPLVSEEESWFVATEPIYTYMTINAFVHVTIKVMHSYEVEALKHLAL